MSGTELALVIVAVVAYLIITLAVLGFIFLVFVAMFGGEE